MQKKNRDHCLQVDGKGADQEQVRAITSQPFVSFVHVAAKRVSTAADALAADVAVKDTGEDISSDDL